MLQSREHRLPARAQFGSASEPSRIGCGVAAVAAAAAARVMRGEASMLAAGRGHAPDRPAQKPRSPSLKALFSDRLPRKKTQITTSICLIAPE